MIGLEQPRSRLNAGLIAVASLLAAAGVGLVASSAYWVALMGDCASGPGRIGDPCPAGFGLRFIYVPLGVVLALVGGGALTAAGMRAWRGRAVVRRLGALATAGALVYAAFGPDHGSVAGPLIGAVIAACFALPGVRPKAKKPRIAAPRARVAPPPPIESAIDDLAKLADLRDRGALTAGEFETQKARILGRARER